MKPEYVMPPCTYSSRMAWPRFLMAGLAFAGLFTCLYIVRTGIGIYRVFRTNAVATASLNHYVEAHRLERAGRLRDAASEYREALRIDSSDTGARYGLGSVYTKMHDLAKAEGQYQAIISLESNDKDKSGCAWAHYYMATLLWQQGKKSDAWQQWRDAVDASPIDRPQQAGIYVVHDRAIKALKDHKLN